MKTTTTASAVTTKRRGDAAEDAALALSLIHILTLPTTPYV